MKSKLLNALTSWAHRKHKSTMRKIETAHPKPTKDGKLSEALNILAGYIDGQCGTLHAYCNPASGEWFANVRDYVGRFCLSARADTPIKLIDKLVYKINRQRLKAAQDDFNKALNEEAKK